MVFATMCLDLSFVTVNYYTRTQTYTQIIHGLIALHNYYIVVSAVCVLEVDGITTVR